MSSQDAFHVADLEDLRSGDAFFTWHWREIGIFWRMA